VLVVDSSEYTGLREWLDGNDLRPPDTILVWNKSDVAAAPEAEADWRFAEILRTSATTGAGCEELARALVEAARSRLESGPIGISRIRHRAALERALTPIRRARELAASEGACELAAVELRIALGELAAVAAPVDNEDVLDRIFSEFCIGK
jgi:tRNA modification GTPase